MKQITEACGCCEGIEIVTPQPTANRPGLSALSYRVGTHATFLETMLARFSNLCLGSDEECLQGKGNYPLQDLTTRDRSDPAIALLDAWAIVADVLAFYNERIINEDYLRTATERRSILELARLVGYKLRPGVASSVYLAYTLDNNAKDDLIIPQGARSQSIPGLGELPQSFEISEDLKARVKWNNLRPRMTQPQTSASMKNGSKPDKKQVIQGPRVYLKGVNTNLKPNDPLLIDFGGSNPFDTNDPGFFRVKEVKPDAATDRTLVTLQLDGGAQIPPEKFSDPVEIIKELTKQPSTQLANSLRLPRRLAEQFGVKKFEFQLGGLSVASSVGSSKLGTQAGMQEYSAVTEGGYAAAKAFSPILTETLATATANAKVTPASAIKVYALRIKAAPFGHNAPLRPDHFDRGRNMVITDEWDIVNPFNQAKPIAGFTADPDAGEPPLTVTFANQSTGDIATYLWEFGDGQTAAFRNPVHTFTEAGTYIVTLTVAGAAGKDKAQRAITVSQIGIVGITGAPLQAVGHKLSPAEALFHQPKLIFLDSDYNISPQSWVVIDKPAQAPLIILLGEQDVVNQSLAAYGITGKTTRLDLSSNTWISETEPFSTIRGTTIYAQSEELELADEPIDNAICGEEKEIIELDDFYEGLEAGRWVIISGEREIGGTSGVKFSELAMLSVVTQDIVRKETAETKGDDATVPLSQPRSGEKTHTFIKLANKLEYCFKRDTVTIYGNVVKATHGETRPELLGSGDGAKPLQSFTLKQPPLTYISASNTSGVDSTLKVYVNDVEWHETDALAGLAPTDRNFVTKTDDEGKTTTIFGNGREGARLPTGIENIKAVYRNGIGKPGNVNAGQISLLTTRPLGVKEVINPLRASGGADKESRDQARKNAPLAIKALDRLVSVQDYEDFSRTYAGVGKARAVEIFDDRRQLVHVTIAGADDIPIDKNSDLYRNLRQTLLDFGDPYQALQLEIRELMLIVIEARLRILPDYLWEPVVTQVRTALLDAFSFERRELGQDVLLSEALSVMQGVRGVAYVDVDVLRGIPEKIVDTLHPGQRRLITPGEIADLVSQPLKDKDGKEIKEPLSRITVNLADREDGTIRPAQFAFFTPEIPATLILNQIT